MEIFVDKKTAKDKKTWLNLQKENIVIESPSEVASCLGSQLINIQINLGSNEGRELGAYKNGDCELMLEFDNGKEWRIYVDLEDKKLHVYSD